MNSSSEYIDDYFQNRLNDVEKKQFEQRCVGDEAFSREVALYITMREGVRQKLLDEKRQLWQEDDTEVKGGKTAGKVFSIRKWFPYAAAASILLAVLLIFTNRPENPHTLASKYIAERFTLLSQTMDASKDSLQQGIAAYNNQQYSDALRLFEKVNQAHPENSTAKKYIGLVYLVTKNYDRAIQQFNELANTPALYKNQGLFLTAVALLQRNRDGDKEQAKQLLQRVVAEKAEGSREAEKWLEKW